MNHGGRCVLTSRVIFACAAGCAYTRQRIAVPEALENEVTVLGSAKVRTWGEFISDHYIASMTESVRQEKGYYAANTNLKIPSTVDMLALSGGGENGAFGAGSLRLDRARRSSRVQACYRYQHGRTDRTLGVP